MAKLRKILNYIFDSFFKIFSPLKDNSPPEIGEQPFHGEESTEE